MVTVPTHASCNSALSKDDEYFRDFLACLPGVDEHPLGLQLIDKMSRNWEKRPHLMRNLAHSKRNIVRESGLYLFDQPTIEVEHDRIERVLGKVVRGLFFVKSRVPLPATYTVQCYRGNPYYNNEWRQYIDAMEKSRGFGDDVFQFRALRHPVDCNQTLWLLVFFGQVAFGAATIPASKATQLPTRQSVLSSERF